MASLPSWALSSDGRGPIMLAMQKSSQRISESVRPGAIDAVWPTRWRIIPRSVEPLAIRNSSASISGHAGNRAWSLVIRSRPCSTLGAFCSLGGIKGGGCLAGYSQRLVQPIAGYVLGPFERDQQARGLPPGGDLELGHGGLHLVVDRVGRAVCRATDL